MLWKIFYKYCKNFSIIIISDAPEINGINVLTKCVVWLADIQVIIGMDLMRRLSAA